MNFKNEPSKKERKRDIFFAVHTFNGSNLSIFLSTDLLSCGFGLLLLTDDQHAGLLLLEILKVLGDGRRDPRLGDAHVDDLDAGLPLVALALQGVFQSFIEFREPRDIDFFKAI